MWLNLSGECATWQEALTPHLPDAERWLRLKLRGMRDKEEALGEALCSVCLDASRAWTRGRGVRLSLRFAVYQVRSGRFQGGRDRGYGIRHRSVAVQQWSDHCEETLHGRELSPVQSAQWSEIRESLPSLLSLVAERLVSGDQFASTARLMKLNRNTLRRQLKRHLRRFQEG